MYKEMTRNQLKKINFISKIIFFLFGISLSLSKQKKKTFEGKKEKDLSV